MLAANEIKVDTNELVQILTLSKKEILELDNPFGCGNSPVFTYPFFGEDQLVNLAVPPGTPESVLESLEILLCIDISLSSSTADGGGGGGCHCFLGVSDEKILRDSRGKIEEKLKEMAESCDFSIIFHHSWSEYQDIIKQQEAFDIKYKSLTDDDDSVVELMDRTGFYNRIQILLPFFIEAATPIDSLDPKWSIYLSIKDENKVINGLLTTYSYFKFPEGSRVRISQVLIFPRYQGHGLGTKLYRRLTQHLRKTENDCVEICVEICVEDPTDGFERLRGLVDWQEAEALGIWATEGDSTSERGESDINTDPSAKAKADSDTSKAESQCDKLIKNLKLNEDHAERLINLNKCLQSPSIPTNPKRFKPANPTDPTTKLRQDVKRWLLKKYRKELPEGKEERIEKLSELYESELIEFIGPLTDLLKK